MSPKQDRKTRRTTIETRLKNTRSKKERDTSPTKILQCPESPTKVELRKVFNDLTINDGVLENSDRRITRSARRDLLKLHSNKLPDKKEPSVTPLVISRVKRTVRKKATETEEIKDEKENFFESSEDDRSFRNMSIGSSSSGCPTPIIISKKTKTVRKKSKPRNKVSVSVDECLRSPKKKVKNTPIECPTPVKKSRNGRASVKEKESPFEGLLRCLHTSEIPNQLVCREEETKKIRSFIKSAISPSGSSSAMYISGVPGTGKTASTFQVLREFQSKNKKFDYCYVNGMELPQPNKVFVEIYKTIFGGKKISPLNARRILNEKFQNSGNKKPVVILIDELDLLCTKKLDIIYDIFNWTTTPSAKVSVIAIANTLDLPERLLNQRITSRLGANRICFQPYDHEQITKIIKKRIEGFTGLSGDAIGLASRKVAALNGDLRKALDILTRAIEITIKKNEKNVTIQNVQQAVKESSSTIDVEYMRNLSLHERYVIEACISQQISSGLEEMSVYSTYQQYQRVCLEREMNPIHLEKFGSLINKMGECNLLSMVKFNGSMLFRIFKLGMTLSEAKFCLESAEENKLN